jgi:hypothetical protein
MGTVSVQPLAPQIGQDLSLPEKIVVASELDGDELAVVARC